MIRWLLLALMLGWAPAALADNSVLSTPVPWGQLGPTQPLSASGASSTVALGWTLVSPVPRPPPPTIAVCNGAADAYVLPVPTSTSPVTTTTGTLVPAGACQYIAQGPSTNLYLAAITGGSATTLTVMTGSGTLAAGGLGSGGGLGVFMTRDAGNAQLPAARVTGLHAMPRVDIRDYTTTPASADAGFAAADAVVVALGGGFIGIPPGVTYTLASGYAASFLVGVMGEEPIIPSATGIVGPHIECTNVSTYCVKVGAPNAFTKAGGLKDLIVSYSGTPVAGAQAVVIQGNNGECQNIQVHNAYDAFTFDHVLSAHCDHLYTSNILNQHVVQATSVEVYLSHVRFGGDNDVDNSDAFFGITGNNPNGLVCDQCQLNLSSKSPHHLFSYYNITNETDGLVTLTNSVVDMSLPATSAGCTSLIKTDASAFVYRLTISTTAINAPSCALIDQSTQLGAPEGLRLVNNPFIAVNDITIDTGAKGYVFDISHNHLTTNVALNSGATNAQGSFSANKLIGNLTVTSTAAWNSLLLDASKVSGTITETAATGKIYYTGPSHNFTAILKYGATTATIGASPTTTETRMPDGSVRYRFGLSVSALGGGTGAATLTGFHYTCSSWAFNSVSQAVLSGSGWSGLTGAPIITIGATGIISLLQSNATGLTALLDTNLPVSAVIKGEISCFPV